MRKFIVALAIFFIMAQSPALASQVTTISFDEQTPMLNYYDQNSYIFALEKMSDGVFYQTKVCSGWDDPQCADKPYTANVIFPVCKSALDRNCIDFFEVTSSNVIDGTSKFIKTINPNGLSESKLKPAGSGLSLFEVPSLNTEGGVYKFAVKVRINFNQNGNRDFSASVIPYTDDSTKYKDPYVRENELVFSPGSKVISGTFGDPKCIWSENGACGIEARFPAGAKVKLTIRVGDYFTPWLHGRLAEPAFDYSDIGSGQYRLTITAKPVEIPGVSADISTSQNIGILQSVFCPFTSPGGFCTGNAEKDVERFVNQNGNRYRDNGWTTPFKIFDSLQQFFPSQASNKKEVWNFRTIPSNGGGLPYLCTNQMKYGSSFLGMINTNAMVYEEGAPKFENSYLNYKVGGVHSNPDGTDFLGTYDLVLNSEFARCLFGISEKASIYSSISVVQGGQESKVQTSFFKDDGNWVRFGAYGFTFSTPTIKVNLYDGVSKDSSKVIGESAKGNNAEESSQIIKSKGIAIQQKSPKIKTLVCMKGKQLKRVKGVSPKCPSGFRKA